MKKINYLLAIITISIFAFSCNSVKHIENVYNRQCESNANPINIANAAKNKIQDEFWNNNKFVDALVLTTEIESKNISLDIRAFQHKFSSKLTKPTWVISYVESKVPMGQETFPAPTIEAHNNGNLPSATAVTYRNLLDKTILTNKNYPVFKFGNNKAQKYYPIIYDVNDPQHIKILASSIYPSSTLNDHSMSGTSYKLKENGEYCKCPDSTDMASYYGTTTHLHGAWVSWHSDGYPNSNYVNTEEISSGCKTHPKVDINWGLISPTQKYLKHRLNHVTFNYSNNFGEAEYSTQNNIIDNTKGKHGATLWYHDHAMMRTATNVYCGLAGAYIIEGEEESNKLTEQLGFDLDSIKRDIPLLITDKSFTNDGELFYYNSTQHMWFDTITKILHNDSLSVNDTLRSGQPEFFGNTIIVNGKVWPYQNVDKGLYRYRLLNTSSSRTYAFELLKRRKGLSQLEHISNEEMFRMIGTESGLIPNNSPIINEGNKLILMPGERADVMINFSDADNNYEYILANFAKDKPFKDNTQSIEDISNFLNTNYVILFKVSNQEKYNISNSKLTQALINWKTELGPKIFNKINSFEKSLTKSLTSPLKYDREETITLEEAATIDKLINIVPAEQREFWNAKYLKNELSFPMVFINGYDWNSEIILSNGKDAVIRGNNGETVRWKIINKTEDAHPIHLHLNRFQVVDVNNNPRSNNEDGWKDVVRVPPSDTAYVIVNYVLTEEDAKNGVGQFVFHCHILEHEDMSMMRRLVIKNVTQKVNYNTEKKSTNH